MNASVQIVLLVTSTSCLGCVAHLGDFPILSSKNNAFAATTARGPRISGEGCVPVVLFPLGQPSMQEAVNHAIEAAGVEYDALVDAVVTWHNYSFVFGKVCYEVEGTPVFSRSVPSPPPLHRRSLKS